MNEVNAMTDILQASFAWHNLPFTILMMLSMTYWAMVFIGVLGMDAFDLDLDSDMDVDVDASASIEPGADLEVETEIAGPEAGEASISADPTGASAWSGTMISVLSFFDLGVLPFMFVFSLFSINIWTAALLIDEFFQLETWWFQIAAYLPILLAASIVTKAMTTPLVLAFKKVDKTPKMLKSLSGQMCRLTSKTDGQRIGSAIVDTEGAPFTVMVKSRGEVLEEGTEALIITKDGAHDCYIVEPL